MILLNTAFKKSCLVHTYQTYTMYFGPDFLFKVEIKNNILDHVFKHYFIKIVFNTKTSSCNINCV